MSKPIDFICVGAQKAATTWLYQHLVKLPDFDLPPRVMMIKDFGRVFLRNHHDVKDVKFLLRWHTMKMTDSNYDRIFRETYGNRITGEITPSYAYLHREDFMRMRDINPNLKIIYILRNPIESETFHC